MDQILAWITNLQLTIADELIIIMILGFIHPIISQPLSLLSVTLTIYFFNVYIGIPYLLVAHILGIVAYYFIVKGLNKKYQIQKKPKLIPAFKWLENTPGYKHSIALGLPLVPTYAIKLAIPMSEKRFKDYFLILLGSYLILLSFNIAFYYGILIVFFSGEITYLTFVVLVLFVLFMYFANTIKNKWINHQTTERKKADI